MTATEIVERIMTQHWDMAACNCWICTAGRKAGCAPREQYLVSRDSANGEYPVVTFYPPVVAKESGCTMPT